eukprot:6213947-Pleurochrysis_carterae.AAC.3
MAILALSQQIDDMAAEQKSFNKSEAPAWQPNALHATQITNILSAKRLSVRNEDRLLAYEI